MSHYFDIVIPKIVLEEIKVHKYRDFTEQKERILDQFDRNYIYKKLCFDKKAVEECSFLIDMKKALDEIKFNVEIIDVCDARGFLDKMRGLALNNKPPFDTKNDKGFKDSILAFAVEEYLEQNPDCEVSFISNDKRLIEYLEKIGSIACFENFDELKKIINQDIGDADSGSKKYTTITGSVTIAESPRRIIIRSVLSDLRNAANFSSVHKAIEKLTELTQEMTPDDFVDTLKSFVNNNQINWICGDEDIKKYYLETFKKYEHILPDELYNDFVIKMGLDKSLIKQTKHIEFNDDIMF